MASVVKFYHRDFSAKPVPIDWTEGRFDGSEVFSIVIPTWNNLEFLKLCHFKGVGRSRVYHFVSKSLGRIEPNPGRKQFLAKWRLAPSTFYRFFLKKGHPFEGPLKEPVIEGKLRRRLLQDAVARFF